MLNLETNQCISSINDIRVNDSNALYQVDDDAVAVSGYESVEFVSLTKITLCMGLIIFFTNFFTVLRDKTFLLKSAFGEGFVLINMEQKKEK